MLWRVNKKRWSGVDLGNVLRAVEDAAPVDAVEAVTRGIGVDLGALWVSFLVADMSGRALVRLAHDVPFGNRPGRRQQDEDVATVLPFDGGPQEQALRSQRVQVRPSGDDHVVMAPVTQRGEAIGLLEISLPVEPDDEALAEISRAAHALAFVVIAARRHTDLFEWGQRTTPFTLAAEIQRRLLPSSFTCEAGSFTLSAWLEPAASIGGDTFDYSLARNLLHLSITDAVGHGVHSALTATLCVGSLRHTRRRGHTLLDQARAANSALIENPPGGSPSPPDFSAGLICAPACWPWSTPATPPLCWCATGPSSPSRYRSIPRSAYCATGPTAQPTSRFAPTIGSSCSPTACWNAAPPASTCPHGCRASPTCTPGRSSAYSATPSSTSPDPPCPTTPACSSSTGTVTTATTAPPRPAPIPTERAPFRTPETRNERAGACVRAAGHPRSGPRE